MLKLIGLALALSAILVGSNNSARADSLVVSVCGTLPQAYLPGATRLDTVDVNGNKCTSGGGGGGGGAVTIADGADVTLGAKADSVCGTSTGTCSLEALIKYLNTQAALIATNTGAAIPAGTAQIGTLNVFAETLASSGVLKTSAGNLFTVSADAVTATTDLKLLIFNSATLPADGTVTPYKCISFKGDGTQASLLLSWAPDALSFTTGISAAVSSATACTTKTNVTATISGQVQ